MKVQIATITYDGGTTCLADLTHAGLLEQVADWCREHKADAANTIEADMSSEETMEAYFDGHDSENIEIGDAEVGVGLEISPMLFLSTSHLPLEMIDVLASKDEFCGTVHEKGDDGFYVHVPTPEEHPTGTDDRIHDKCPDELKRLIRFAQSKGCEWIALDSDGPVVEGLPTWSW